MSDTPKTLESLIERLEKIKIKNPLDPTKPAPYADLGIKPESLKAINDTPCPYCSTTLSAASDMNGKATQPKEGSFSICTNCGEIVVFGKELQLRKPSFEDWNQITNNPKLEKSLSEAQARVTKFNAEK